MNHNDKLKAILHIRPKAIFNLDGDNLEWLDKKQTEPTEQEIEAGLIAYEAAQQAEAETKAAKRVELLSRLGITEEEARILLG